VTRAVTRHLRALYTDDWLIGFAGPRGRSRREIKQEVSKYLQTELKLELSDERLSLQMLLTESYEGYGLRTRER